MMWKRLAQPEMNYERRQNYLKNVYDAETRRKQVAAMKTQASNKLQRGEITAEEEKKIYEESDRLQRPIREFKNKMKHKMKSFKAKGQKGRGVVFYHNPQELLKKVSGDSGRNGSR